MKNILGNEEPKLEPIHRPGREEPTDYQIFKLLEEQWSDGDGALRWVIEEGLSRGIIKKVNHPDFPVIKDPWYTFIRRPEKDKPAER